MNNNDLRHLSPEALAQLGAPYLVYIRPLHGQTGPAQYVIHAANGTPLSIIGSHQEAIAAARQNNLQPMTVH
ncbi:MAG: DUF1150 family protein [Proteobacteria bacterium]|nr:DUF1150 family protein [Pseudomonadota bacterium]